MIFPNYVHCCIYMKLDFIRLHFAWKQNFFSVAMLCDVQKFIILKCYMLLDIEQNVRLPSEKRWGVKLLCRWLWLIFTLKMKVRCHFYIYHFYLGYAKKYATVKWYFLVPKRVFQELFWLTDCFRQRALDVLRFIAFSSNSNDTVTSSISVSLKTILNPRKGQSDEWKRVREMITEFHNSLLTLSKFDLLYSVLLCFFYHFYTSGKNEFITNLISSLSKPSERLFNPWR